MTHVDGDKERPIAFASRTLYCQHCTLVMNHRPLLGFFGEMKAIPEHASARVQLWAVLLFGYNNNLVHRPGVENNADVLSRLPLPPEKLYEHNVFVPEDINFLFNILITKRPLNVEQIAIVTQNDQF